MQGQPEFSSETAVIDTLRCNEFTAQLLDSTGAPKHLYGIKEKDHFVEAYVEAKEGEQVSAKLDSWDRSHIYKKELEELQEMERLEDLVLEKRRRLTGGSNSLRNANASTQAGESSISVKKEPTESGAGSAGTADEPLIIADLSD
ncbi:unnamed protein product [Tilletia controversa]|nr:unnamed protein product [Tilletia controversa]